jgi:hypothetical protein
MADDPRPSGTAQQALSVARGAGRDQRADLAELRLFRYALTQTFAVPQETKRAALERVDEVLRGGQTSHRTIVAAARVLTAMVGTNLSAIDVALRARAAEDLVEQVEQLRAEVEAIRKGDDA